MGLFEQFPYTNFHEVNLGWFLDTFNNLLRQWDEQQQEFSDLKDAWQQLHDYVENYFDNLDVQQEINNKLDEMLASGELQTILDGLFASFEYDYDTRLTLLEGRMDTFASLPPGSTSGNAELLDIRVAADGSTYPSAGDAVRGQIEKTLRIMSVTGLADLNNATDIGSYELEYSATYTNDPIGPNTRRLLRVYQSESLAYINQHLVNIETGQEYYRWRAGGTWSSWVKDMTFRIADATALTDLNNAKEFGSYVIGYSATPSNDPIGPSTRRILRVYPSNSSLGYIIQEIYDANTGVQYFRWLTGGSWTAWIENISFRIGSVSGVTDLDNVKRLGSYLFGYSTSLTNDPIGPNTRRILRVYPSTNNYGYIIQEIINAVNGEVYYRWLTGGAWSAWRKPDNDARNNVSYDFSLATSNATAEVKGTVLKVVSYNVALYNHDTATYLPEAKRFQLKSMLSELNADIIGVQEDREYIDSANTRLTIKEVYAPILPKIVGTGGPTIRSRKQPTSYGIVYYTSGRAIRWAVYDINGSDLLVISTHPTPGAGQEVTRMQEYTELFDWIAGDIQLSSTDAPTWDYCIITGDMNSNSATDKTNLATVAAANYFTMANGGYLGWITTGYQNSDSSPFSLDNIICSQNITITNIRAYTGRYFDLYSDHVPLAADLVLN